MAKIDRYFETSYFLQGLGAGALIIVLFLGWIEFSGSSSLDKKYENLDSITVEIDWSEFPADKLRKLMDEEGVGLSVQKQPLPIAEIENIQKFTKNTPTGPIPKIAADGTTPFRAFSRPYIPSGAAIELPKVSIVVMDYCMSDNASKLILDRLPSPVSLVLNPYCDNPKGAVDKAVSLGHEVWLGLPMQTENYPLMDIGPLSLLINASEDTNLNTTKKVMATAYKYPGIVSLFKPVFIKSEKDFTPILEFIGKTGLGYFDTNIAPPKYIENFSNASDIPYTHADVHIDSSLTEYDIRLRLAELRRIAAQRGQAVGVIHATPLSIREVSAWTKTVSDQNLSLAPASALARF